MPPGLAKSERGVAGVEAIGWFYFRELCIFFINIIFLIMYAFFILYKMVAFPPYLCQNFNSVFVNLCFCLLGCPSASPSACPLLCSGMS